MNTEFSHGLKEKVCIVTDDLIFDDTKKSVLVCIVSGVVKYVRGADEKMLATGDTVVSVGGFTLKGEMPFTALSVIQPEVFFDGFPMPVITGRQFYPTPTTSALSAEITALLSDGKRDSSTFFVIGQYLRAFCASLYRQCEEIETAKNESERIISFLDSPFSFGMSTEKIAEALGTDKYKLARFIKKETGVSLCGYLQSKRLEQSKILLMSGKSAHEVSTLCGYRDYSAFFRAYKRFFGSSPKKNKNKI